MKLKFLIFIFFCVTLCHTVLTAASNNESTTTTTTTMESSTTTSTTTTMITTTTTTTDLAVSNEIETTKDPVTMAPTVAITEAGRETTEAIAVTIMVRETTEAETTVSTTTRKEPRTTSTSPPTTTTQKAVFDEAAASSFFDSIGNATEIKVDAAFTSSVSNLVSNMALVLVQSDDTSESSTNTNSSTNNSSSSSNSASQVAAAIASLAKVGNLAESMAGTEEGSTTALSIVFIIVDVSSNVFGSASSSSSSDGSSGGSTSGSSSSSSKSNARAAAVVNNVLSVISNIAAATKINPATGSVAVSFGGIKLNKQTCVFENQVRNTISVASSSSKRAAGVALFLAGVNAVALTNYVNAYPTNEPQMSSTALATPNMFPVQNGLSDRSRLACPYMYYSNQVVTLSVDNTTEYYIRPEDGEIAFVEFNQINTLDAACNFGNISFTCGRWDKNASVWLFTDCVHKYENDTHKCSCKRLGTFGLFASTVKSISESLTGLQTVNITNTTDFATVYNTVNTAFSDLEAYYTANFEYSVTITNQILELIDNIAESGSTTVDSIIDVLDVFNLFLNKDLDFFTKMNARNNLATNLLVKLENVFKTVQLTTTDLDTYGTGFRVYGTNPSARNLYGVYSDDAGSMTATRDQPFNATDAPEAAKFGAFLDETAVANAGSDLSIFFIVFDTTSNVVQTLLLPGTNCNNFMVSPKLLMVKGSKTIAPVGGKLFSSFHFQNNTVSDGDCKFYTQFTYSCVYYDTTTLSWSTNGCTHEYTDGQHKCSCDHLTTFALTVTGGHSTTTGTCDWCDTAEFSSTVVGGGIFIVFAIIAVILLLVDLCSEKIPRSASYGKLHQFYPLLLILLINLMLFNAFYIVFGFLNYSLSNTSLCESIGILLHYFLITTFGLLMLIAILRFVQIYVVLQSSAKFTAISSILLYFVAGIIVMIAIVVPKRLVKYISAENKCWLHDAHLGFGIAPPGVCVVVSTVFFVLILLQVKFQLLRKEDQEQAKRPKGFEILGINIILVVLAVCAWFFAFMVMYPQSTSLPHLHFIFALVYCVCNTAFAIFVLIASLLLSKLTKRPNRIASSPSRNKVVERSINADRFRGINNTSTVSKRQSSMTPVSE